MKWVTTSWTYSIYWYLSFGILYLVLSISIILFCIHLFDNIWSSISFFILFLFLFLSLSLCLPLSLSLSLSLSVSFSFYVSSLFCIFPLPCIFIFPIICIILYHNCIILCISVIFSVSFFSLFLYIRQYIFHIQRQVPELYLYRSLYLCNFLCIFLSPISV